MSRRTSAPVLIAVLTAGLAGALTHTTAGTAAAAPRPAVTAVSPSAGRVTAGTLITVHGPGVGAATRVLFGSGSSTTIKRLSATGIVVAAPAHVASRVHLRVVTAAGTSRAADANRYTFRTAPAVPTGPVDTPLPDGVQAYQVSCGSPTNCVGLFSVDDENEHTHTSATHFDGTSWSAPYDFGQLFSATCFPTGTCIAHDIRTVDNDPRRTLIFEGGRWRDYSSTVPSSCETFASRYFCLGSGTRRTVVYDHGRPSRALTVRSADYPLDFVNEAACPSTTTCYVLTYDMRVARYTVSAGWSPLRRLPNIGPSQGTKYGSSFTCPTATSCVVIHRSRVSWLHDGLWSFAQPIAAGYHLFGRLSLSCATSHYCVGNATTRTPDGAYEIRRVSYDGTAVDSDVIKTEIGFGRYPEQLSCPVVGSCVTVYRDTYGVLTS